MIAAYKLRPFNSDEVFWQVILRSWHPFEGSTVTLGNSSVYVDKIPFYMILESIFEPGRRVLLLEATVSTFLGFSAFYVSCLYFLRKLKVDLTYSTLLPFVWLASFGYYFIQLYLNANWRGFQLGVSFAIFALVAAIYYGDITFRSLRSKLALVLVTAFIGLQIYSDPYLLFFTVGPIMVMSLVIYGLKVIDRYKAIIVIISGILSYAFAKIFSLVSANSGIRISTNYPMEFVSFDKIADAFGTSIHSMLIIFGADFFGKKMSDINAVSALLNFFIVGVIIFTCYGMIQKGRHLKVRKISLHCTWLLFFVSLSIMVFGAYTFSTMAVGVATYRYFLLLALLFILLLAISIGSRGNSAQKYALLCILLLSTTLNLGLTAFSDRDMQQPEVAANKANSLNFTIVDSLRSKGVTKGYANYWHGDINTYLSNGQISFLPSVCAGGETKRFQWLINDTAFNKVADETFYLDDPDITAPATCKLDDLVKQFGQPKDIIKISNKTILLYDYDITTRINGSSL